MQREQKKITIDDIAKDLGVSKTTVSRAISGKGRIGKETVDRVNDYIKQCNYKPNVIAKGLAQSKTYNIGLMIPGDYDLVDLPFFQKCMLGVCEMASAMDYDVIISMIKDADISQMERLVDNHKVDGFVLSRTLVEDAPMKFLKERKIPFVAIGRTEEDNVVQVDNDHRGACRELTSILLSRGIRKIALIGGNRNHIVTQNRLLGYMEAYEDLRKKPDNKLIYMEAEGRVRIEQIVDDLIPKKADCILCMDDSICAYVLAKLKKEKIRVPQDIKVASFYNSTTLEYNMPAITSLQFDGWELGRVACQALLTQIDGKAVESQILLGYEVSMKESTK